MTERTLAIDGVEVPRFLYGTAWKEGQTQHFVELALERGFRGLDTANQRRHYDEAAVGRAIAASIAKGKPSSRSGAARTIACPTIPEPQSPSRSSNRSPVRLGTWVSSRSTRICCTGRQVRRG